MIILYVAQSIDGYIADEKDGLDWLPEIMPKKFAENYENFIKSIDIVAMGKNTYEHIITKLSPDVWPYPEQESYIWTNQKIDHEKCIAENKDVADFASEHKDKRIWVVGGANFINQWIKKDLIDMYIIATAPVLLGEGIRLFDNHKIHLDVESVLQDGNLTQISYIRAK